MSSSKIIVYKLSLYNCIQNYIKLYNKTNGGSCTCSYMVMYIILVYIII